MAMHHRRHNPASGGGANPFTGRSLPSGGRGGGGAGYHGNSPSLIPSMAKKSVFLVATLTIFFYVLFAPEYDDVPYEASRPQQKKESVKKNSDAINNSVVDFSKTQSEPVKLNLPDITPDPQDIINVEEEKVESADYESKMLEDEDEDKEGRLGYDSNDQGEQSADNNTWEDNEDTTAEGGEQLSPAEKIYGAHVHVDEEGSEDQTQSDPFLGLGDESEEKDDEKADSNDMTRGGLRGSNSAENKDPFGRQEETGDTDETKEEEEEEQVVESSQDDPVNVMENTTFYKNQSPLEMPIEVEDESIKSSGTKSMEDAINEVETDTVMDVAVKKNETVVEDSAQTFDEDNNSEDFSNNGKAAFEAKYGNASKSMEEELNAESALESDEYKNQSPLEIPIGDASGVTGLNQTKVGQSSKNMEESIDTLPKSMADEVDKEEKDSRDEDFGVKKNETNVKTMSNDLDANEESEVNDEDNDESTKEEQDNSELGDDTDEDSEVNKGALSVENKFKEYLITNSEDEPDKNEKNGENYNPASEKSEDIEESSIVKDIDNSKDDESKKLGNEEKEMVEDTDGSVKDNGSDDASVQGDNVDEDSKAKENVVDKKSEDVSKKVEVDLSDNEVAANLNATLTSDAGESADSGADDEEKAEEPDKTLKIIDSDNSKDDASKGLGAEEKDEVGHTDESVENNGSNDVSVQGNDVDEDSKAKKKSEYDSQEAEKDLIDNEAVSSLNETLASDAGESVDSGVEEEETVEEPDQTLKKIEGSNDASEPGENADKDIIGNKTAETSEHGEYAEEDSTAKKKKSSIRGAAVDKKSKNKPTDDVQKVEKDEEDLNLSSPEVVQADKNDESTESVADGEGKVEDNDEPTKNKGSNDPSEQDKKGAKDSKAKKTESIRGASDKKSSKGKEKADDLTHEEGKETAADKAANGSEDATDLGDDADEESKGKSNENGGSKDESQELNMDLGDSEALPNNGNKTLDQIGESEGASDSVEGAEVSGDDKEGDANADSKKVNKKKKKEKTSFISSLGGIFKESDAGKDENIEAKASKSVESEENAEETTAQNEDKESLNILEDASNDKNNDESDSPEKAKADDDVKYAKVASDSKESAAIEHDSDNQGTDEPSKVKKSKAKKSESEESEVNEDEKAIPILGDLGEAIKESDATLDNDEAITDKKDGAKISKLDSEATQIKPSNGKGDKDEEAVSQKKSNEQIEDVADTKESVVGKDKTATKKDKKKRKEKK